MRTILTTVGTSLLSNARRTYQDTQPSDQKLLTYLRNTENCKACAEANSLSRLLEPDDKIVFLHSHTDAGTQCARVLQEHYRYSGYSSEIREICDLAYSESRFKILGLRSLVATLVELIVTERKSHRKVLINATGGFKAESAYATLVGLVFNVPVYYIHEAFQDIIKMPFIPLSWDYSIIADHAEFFTWLDSDLRKTEDVELRLRELPNEIAMLLVEDEGYTYLSPTGEIFFMAYSEALSAAAAVPVEFSKQARKTYQTFEPATKKSFDRLISKLRIRNLRNNGSARVNISDCLVYPRGNRPERLFYYEDDNILKVCELALHGDSYEKLLKNGVYKKDYIEFKSYSEIQ